MKTRNAPRLLASLYVLPLLASCGLLPSKPVQPVVTRTEIVTVSVPAYQPLPSDLTSPIPEPPAPLLACTDSQGRPAVCVLDALATIPAYQAVIAVCNGDRARAALLGVTDGQR